MNTFLPIIFFSLFLILILIGVIFTLNNNKKLNQIVSEKKLIKKFKGLSIKDTELFNMNLWIGDLKIYEDVLRIEKANYFFHIQLSDNTLSNTQLPMTISLEGAYLENQYLFIKGVKKRKFGKGKIKIRIKANKKSDLIYIYNHINNYRNKT